MTAPDVTCGDTYALVHLDAGVMPLTRSTDAHDHADAFRRAALHLEEVERQTGAKKDREAARALNFSWRRRNLAPVGTLTPTSTTVQHVEPVGSCACSCSAVCGADHSDGAA